MADENFVRQNVWTLDAIDHWHPIIHAYALGVGVLIERSKTDPLDPIGWLYQSDIHGADIDPDDFRNQCQHFSWFFLPWHRMYLTWFERIVRSAISGLDEIDDDVKKIWALPYWDYSSAAIERRKLPRAFVDTRLPDGVTPNPLRVRGRNLNDGSALTTTAVRLKDALAPTRFTGIGGFAGGRTGWNHFFDDPGAAGGPLENSPHGAVHNQVGGLMADFNTAALDPIFWLHHANVDRLWEVWRTMPGRSNTTETAWLTGVVFHFHDENGTPRTQTAQDVLETIDQLDYNYEDISAPPQSEAVVIPTPEPDNPPELVGATDSALELSGEPAAVTFGVFAPEGPVTESVASETRAHLRLDDVTSAEPAGVTYQVYVNVPDGDPSTDDAHFVGLAAFFGVEQTANPDNAHGGMRLVFDISELYQRLNEEGRWSDAVTVTFLPEVVVQPETPIELPADEVAVPQRAGTIRVGQVSVFLQ